VGIFKQSEEKEKDKGHPKKDRGGLGNAPSSPVNVYVWYRGGELISSKKRPAKNRWGSPGDARAGMPSAEREGTRSACRLLF